MHLSQLQADLKALGKQSDASLPLAKTLIMLGALQHDLGQVEPCLQQLKTMQQALQKHENNTDHLTALNAVLLGEFAYHVETDQAKEFASLDLLCALQRQPVHPMILSILFIELARSKNWNIEALNFPQHLLLRIEQQQQRLIFDPAAPQNLLQASDLRHLLQEDTGLKTGLSHEYYAPLTNREIILRICNRKKTLLIEAGDYLQALQVIQRALWVAPYEPRLYFDAAVMCMKSEREPRAARYFEDFIQRSDDPNTLAEAQSLLRGLYRRLQ